MTYRAYYTTADPRTQPRRLEARPWIEITAATPKAAHGRAAAVLSRKFDRFHIGGIVGPFDEMPADS